MVHFQLFLKDQCVVELPDALICDGIIDEDNLKLLNRDINWLKKELKKQGVDKIEDVFIVCQKRATY